MIVLGIETSSMRASVALVTADEVIGSYELGRGKTQDQVLMPAAQMLLDDAGLEWSRVGGIAVGIGPGLFTGLRVGVATAKALAQTLGISIAALPSMDVLAHSVRYTNRLICTCTDARRSEVYWAFYRATPGGVQRLSDFRCAPPEHCRNEIDARGEAVLVVGNGAQRYADAFGDGGPNTELAGVVNGAPTAAALAELAVGRLVREDADRLADIHPLYVRKTDAELAFP